MPDYIMEEFAMQRAKMMAIVARMESDPDDVLTMEGEVILTGEPARAISATFLDMAHLNLHLMDIIVKRFFH